MKSMKYIITYLGVLWAMRGKGSVVDFSRGQLSRDHVGRDAGSVVLVCPKALKRGTGRACIVALGHPDRNSERAQVGNTWHHTKTALVQRKHDGIAHIYPHRARCIVSALLRV